ncbi:MAG: hypothetical protein A07HR60_01110 [uncultured archaeon A07HR60]|nr:MAG: hypothetical protein A07HR60_01110 [uncultured archaeon A07HR60]
MRFRGSGRGLTADGSAGIVRAVANTDARLLFWGPPGCGAERVGVDRRDYPGYRDGRDNRQCRLHYSHYPTLSEAMMEAVENAGEKAIHALNR